MLAIIIRIYHRLGVNKNCAEAWRIKWWWFRTWDVATKSQLDHDIHSIYAINNQCIRIENYGFACGISFPMPHNSTAHISIDVSSIFRLDEIRFIDRKINTQKHNAGFAEFSTLILILRRKGFPYIPAYKLSSNQSIYTRRPATILNK